MQPQPQAISPIRRLALDFLIAAVVITPLDALQVHVCILTAGSPFVLVTAVRFGLVGIALGLIGPRVDARPHPNGKVGIATDAATFVAAYLLTVALSERSNATIATALALTVAIGGGVALVSKIPVRELAPFVFLLGVGGPLVEATGVALGFFHYAQPDFIGVPGWLPLLWTSGAFLARDLFSATRSALRETAPAEAELSDSSSVQD